MKNLKRTLINAIALNAVEITVEGAPYSELDKVKKLTEKAAKAFEDIGFRLIRVELKQGYIANFYFSRSPIETKENEPDGNIAAISESDKKNTPDLGSGNSEETK